MRLRRLDLLRYGHFTDHSLDFGPAVPGEADLHLVYGPNEAGKSTSMAAILDLLFGMRAQKHPYAFKHEVKTLAIGGALEIDGVTHHLRRVRGRNSLLDASGAPIDEGVLAAGLGGMDRAGFEALFALDDETLERGGEDILASRGDLGEMLFAASAGLSELSKRLGAVRAELDAFDRPRATSTDLRKLTREDEDLAAQVKALDVPAPEHAKLVRAEQEAKVEHDAAAAARAAARIEVRRAQAKLAALPALGRVHALRVQLAAAGTGPDAPDGWATELPELRARDAAMARDLAHARAAAEAAIAEAPAPPDADALANADAVDRLNPSENGLQARFLSAGQDLAARRDEVAALDRRIADEAAKLDPGAEPGALRLDAVQEAEAKALIAAWSGIAAQLAAAAQERADAAGRLTPGPAAAPPAADPAALRDAARALDRSAHRAQIAAADHAIADADRALATTLPALAPWNGNPADLAAMAPPGPARLADWQIALTAAATDLAARADAVARARAQADAARIDLAAHESRAEGLTDGDAAAARATRAAAWADLRAGWTDTGAAIFERAMAADDALGGARLAAANDLADLRAAQDDARRADAAAAEAEALFAAAAARNDAVRADIAAVAAALAPGWPDATLSALTDWIAARDAALTALSARAAAAASRDAATAARADLRAAVAAALGADAPDAPDDALSRAADDAAERAATAARDAAAATDAAAQATRDLAARDAALAAAEAARDGWMDRLRALRAAAPWIAPEGAAPAEAIAAALASLARITPLIDQRRDRAHRIAAMERDRAAFEAAVADLAVRMDDRDPQDGPHGDPATDPVRTADRLRARVAAARLAETERARHAARRDAAHQALTNLMNEAETLAARRAAITSHFSVTGWAEAAEALAAAQTRARLRDDLFLAERDLAALMSAPSAADAETMLAGAETETLRDALSIAEAAEKDAEAAATVSRDALRDAEKALAAIGAGDDAALLVQRRAALHEDIAAKTRAHLAMRLGLMAAERALRVQRDRLRSGMLDTASAAFATITGGAYPVLRVEPAEDGEETLLAKAADGTVRRAHELSKGTRFQLYLALRFAGRQELSTRRTPAPFLLDDILETFDEDRSTETFRLLGAAAQQGQAIYFTHHRHLCEIARSACPDVKLHFLVSG